jgi:NADH-quinone oxidoreductase subunit N
MLIGLTAAPYLAAGEPGGVSAVLYYLVAYGAMTLGAFGVIALLNTGGRRIETVDDLGGLSRTHPGVALLMALFLFSLIGLPATAGFAGKLQLFWGALEVRQQAAGDAGWLYMVLAVAGSINAAIGAYYYLRIISVMYLRGAVTPLPQTRSWPALVSLWICAVVTIWLGISGGPMQRVLRIVTAGEPAEVVQR